MEELSHGEIKRHGFGALVGRTKTQVSSSSQVPCSILWSVPNELELLPFGAPGRHTALIGKATAFGVADHGKVSDCQFCATSKQLEVHFKKETESLQLFLLGVLWVVLVILYH